MKIDIPMERFISMHGGEFMAGFSHPVLGFDHLLAMVSVGIVASIIGGKANYLVPMSFVFMMVVGSIIGFYGLSVVYDEVGIAISVLILGLYITFSKKKSLGLAMILVAFFAFFHGHAHGVEMPKMTTVSTYISGFMTATILLHILGVLSGYASARVRYGTVCLKGLGVAIAFVGLVILLRH
jgi:urease accessory protein